MFGFEVPWWAWGASAAALAAIAVFWPLPTHIFLEIDVFERDVRGTVKGLLGRVDVRSVQTKDGGLNAEIEIWILHFIPIRRRAAGGDSPTSPLSKGGRANVRLEDGNLLALLDELWDRWRQGLVGIAWGIRRLLPRLRFQDVRLAAEVGFVDAARTAVACGILWSLFGVASGWMMRGETAERMPRMKVAPVYNRWRLTVRLDVRCTIRPVDLGAAALSAFTRSRVGREGAGAVAVVRPQNV